MASARNSERFEREVSEKVEKFRREFLLNSVFPGTTKKFRDCAAADVRAIAKGFNLIADKLEKGGNTIGEIIAK